MNDTNDIIDNDIGQISKLIEILSNNGVESETKEYQDIENFKVDMTSTQSKELLYEVGDDDYQLPDYETPEEIQYNDSKNLATIINDILPALTLDELCDLKTKIDKQIISNIKNDISEYMINNVGPTIESYFNLMENNIVKKYGLIEIDET